MRLNVLQQCCHFRFAGFRVPQAQILTNRFHGAFVEHLPWNFGLSRHDCEEIETSAEFGLEIKVNIHIWALGLCAARGPLFGRSGCSGDIAEFEHDSGLLMTIVSLYPHTIHQYSPYPRG